jgi:cell division topological specificity factor
MMKNELLEVISRHVEIDPSTVRIDMAQEGREQRLIADIPIVQPGASAKRKRAS